MRFRSASKLSALPLGQTSPLYIRGLVILIIMWDLCLIQNQKRKKYRSLSPSPPFLPPPPFHHFCPLPLHHTHTCMHTSTHTLRECTCTLHPLSTHTHTHTHTQYMHTHTHTQTRTHTCTRTHTHTHMPNCSVWNKSQPLK